MLKQMQTHKRKTKNNQNNSNEVEDLMLKEHLLSQMS
jgi:hypothetical protein